MSDRPAPVTIEDLAEPVRSDDARMVLGFMADAGRGSSSRPGR